MSQVEAAGVFGVTRQAVGRWVGTVREKGTKALRARRRGRPAEIQLAADEAAWVRRQIVSRTPDQLALKFFLWTREAVRDLIAAEFGMSLSIWTVGRYLKAWGSRLRSPFAAPSSRSRRKSSDGSTRVIPPFGHRRCGKRPRFTGATRRECDRTTRPDGPMADAAGRLSFGVRDSGLVAT